MEESALFEPANDADQDDGDEPDDLEQTNHAPRVPAGDDTNAYLGMTSRRTSVDEIADHRIGKQASAQREYSVTPFE